MFLSQFLFAALVVLHLVGQFGLVLGPDEFGPGSLHQAQLPELQLLGGLVVPQQHGALQVLLGLLLVQVLDGRRDPKSAETQEEGGERKQTVTTDICVRL